MESLTGGARDLRWWRQKELTDPGEEKQQKEKEKEKEKEREKEREKEKGGRRRSRRRRRETTDRKEGEGEVLGREKEKRKKELKKKFSCGKAQMRKTEGVNDWAGESRERRKPVVFLTPFPHNPLDFFGHVHRKRTISGTPSISSAQGHPGTLPLPALCPP
ncbi:unnamed protein product [Pleuronectes platessa]|uniref:Uncharacterized protein n=1 Tax=Pleuronectes platessa TaxID=8262 RepID=A0A9N7TRL5_PLEPL|nr:unnamed protein product [Pleuronectes platessa]